MIVLLQNPAYRLTSTSNSYQSFLGFAMKFQHLLEQTISSVQTFQGNFLKVIQDVVKLPNDKYSTREYIQHPGAVAILALTNDMQIVMEYQYRHSVKTIMLEIPAGKLDLNEEHLACGKRELLEETGYIAQNWTKLGETFACIGYSDEKIIYYLARDITLNQRSLDENEFLEVELMSLENVMDKAFKGGITDNKTLAGLMLLNGHLKK